MSEISQEQAIDEHHPHDDDDDESNSRKEKIPRTTKEVELPMPVLGVILPDDILLHILFSLSPLEVVRLLYTSKNGYYRMSDPSFLRNHARVFHTQRYLDNRPRPVLPPGLLFSTNHTVLDSTKHPLYVHLSQDQNQDHQEELSLKAYLDRALPSFKHQFPCSFIVGSCNGLLLYCDTGLELAPGVHNQYKVANPLISQYKEVPIMDLLRNFKQPLDQIRFKHHPRILFDPSLLLYYKLLVLLLEPPYTEYQLHVYSSQTKSWRLLAVFPHQLRNCVRWETVMSGGVFYWLRDHDSICFDFVEETVWFEPLPIMSVEFTDRDIFYLGECRGRVRLIEEHNTDRILIYWFPLFFKMMEMHKELDSTTTSWTEKSRVIIDTGYEHLVDEERDGYQDGIQVMHLYETEKGEEAVLLNIDYQRLISFNITTRTFGEEITLPPYRERYYGIEAFPFTPTLFPLRT